MLRYTHEKVLPYAEKDLFELVLDIPSYPDFLPWVFASKIVEGSPQKSPFYADLSIGYQLFNETYTSRVTFSSYDWIKAEHIKGPFKHMVTLWTFSKDPVSKTPMTRVHFSIECAFQSFLLQKLLENLMKDASENIIDAFEKRMCEQKKTCRKINL